MAESLTSQINILLCGAYQFNDWISERTICWCLVTLAQTVSIEFLIQHPDRRKFITGIVLFALYNLCMIYTIFYVDWYKTFIIFYLLAAIILFVQYFPILNLEHNGAGSILRFLLNGFLMSQLNSIVLTDQPSFKCFLFLLASHSVYQAWRLTHEYQTIAEDNKKNIKTTAVLLGRHDCFKFFVLFHFFSWGYIVLDSILDSYWSSLPLILVPWTFSQMHRLRHMEVKYLNYEALAYFAAFSLLSIAGLVFKQFNLP